MGSAAELPDDVGIEDTEGAGDAAVENTEAGTTTESNEVFDQASEYVGKENTEDEEPEAEAKEDEDDAPKKPQPKAKQQKQQPEKNSRYEQRVRALVERSKKAEEYAAHVQRQYQQQAQQQAQYQRQLEQRYTELEKQHAVAAREMELIRQREEAAQEAQLDPLEKAMRIERRKAMSEVEGRMRQEYDQRLYQMQQQQQQLVQHLQQQKQESEIQSRIQGYERDTDMSISEMLKGLPTEKITALAPSVKTMVLNLAAATNRLPKDAAKEWDRIAHTYVLNKMKLRSSAAATTAANGAKIPPGAPAGKRPAKGNGRMTQEQARKSGYGSALEAMVANSPPSWST